MKCGDIYVGKCLGSYEPALWFYYVLLSRDKEEGVYFWSTAKFMQGHYGAQVEKFTDDEIRQLGYVGHISSVLINSIQENEK